MISVIGSSPGVGKSTLCRAVPDWPAGLGASVDHSEEADVLARPAFRNYLVTDALLPFGPSSVRVPPGRTGTSGSSRAVPAPCRSTISRPPPPIFVSRRI
ncbi:hypothetical protein [Streptomyces sp. NPDC058694]|uniref:hypothetical protein n=1 Tax=Streptomyces sp. NPDC058694 TaxID=3346603 RepID=UPI00365D3A17